MNNQHPWWNPPWSPESTQHVTVIPGFDGLGNGDLLLNESARPLSIADYDANQQTLNHDLVVVKAQHSMLMMTMAAGEDVQHTVNQILQVTAAMLTEFAHAEILKECLEQQEMAKEDERSCTTRMSQAEHSNEREKKFPENIEKPGEGLVRNQNVIRSVKEIKDGLLEEAVGITPMETDQEETEQEETKEGNPEETSTYSTNTSRELIEAVGIRSTTSCGGCPVCTAEAHGSAARPGRIGAGL
jgi:hypothetical protein